jgi:hypothetical protein
MDGFFYVFSPVNKNLRAKESLDDCIIQNSRRSTKAFKVIIGSNKYTIKSKTIDGKRKLMDLFRDQKSKAV